MTIDRDVVTRKLLLIASDLEPLRGIAEHGVEAYAASPVDQAMGERRLERAIGRMIDVNFHLLTASGQPPPQSTLSEGDWVGRATLWQRLSMEGDRRWDRES